MKKKWTIEEAIGIEVGLVLLIFVGLLVMFPAFFYVMASMAAAALVLYVGLIALRDYQGRREFKRESAKLESGRSSFYPDGRQGMDADKGSTK